MIQASIERDTRRRWHPVITIQQRGVVVFAITSITGYLTNGLAMFEAMKEAKRVEATQQ